MYNFKKKVKKMENTKKNLLLEAFKGISVEEIEKIKGGVTSFETPTPGIQVTQDLDHGSCLSCYDCWCEPHCIMGITCTSNCG